MFSNPFAALFGAFALGVIVAIYYVVVRKPKNTSNASNPGTPATPPT